MPVDVSGQLIPFTATEIDDMNIETIGVRQMEHPVETREVGTNTQRRPFLVNWDSREDFCELVLGRSKLYTVAGFDQLSRLVPDEFYGRHPDHQEWIATKIEKIAGFGKAHDDVDTGMPVYETARIDVFYEHVPFDVASDDEVTVETDRYIIPPGVEPASSNADIITMPGSAFHYIREEDSGSDTGTTPHMVPIPYNIGFVTATQERKFTWVRLPADAWGPGTPLHDRVFSGEDDGIAIHTQTDIPWLGTINSEDLFMYPTGTMLFRRVEEKLRRDPLGDGWCWDLTFVFDYKPSGWNWFRYFDTSGSLYSDNGIYFASADNGFYTADILPDGRGLYNARDHNDLFKVGLLS